MTGPAVSVVIPTLNAAHHLEALLSRLRSQTGVPAVETIVVDSGSADGTPEVARQLGARVVEIAPEEFSHSGARNLGGSQASCELLLFTTQDAMPSSDSWLSELISKKETLDVVALSCREVPRPGSDLFSRVQNWYHYDRFLELRDGDRVLTLPPAADALTLRRSAQLSNVACLLATDVHRSYPFRYEYAEDLDLGVRLVRDGRRLGLVSTPHIVHSHLRPPHYHLKRGFVDKLVVSRILGEPPPAREIPEAEVEAQILEAFAAIASYSLSDLVSGGSIEIEDLRGLLSDRLSSPASPPAVPTEVRLERVDAELAAFLRTVSQRWTESGAVDPVEPYLRKGVLAFLELALDYLAESSRTADRDALRGLDDAKVKQFAALCGAYLANCYRSQGDRPSGRIREYHGELADGRPQLQGRVGTDAKV